MSERHQQTEFTTPLYCGRCKQSGFAIWARNKASRWRSVTATSPVGTSDGFYLRANMQLTANPQIVCGKCGTVHRDGVDQKT
jgi:ribosomal protein S27AE